MPKATALGETGTITTGTDLNEDVPDGATTVRLYNDSNTENRAMYPAFYNRDCDEISNESTNAIAVGGNRIYALPEGTTEVRFTPVGGTVSNHTVRFTFN